MLVPTLLNNHSNDMFMLTYRSKKHELYKYNMINEHRTKLFFKEIESLDQQVDEIHNKLSESLWNGTFIRPDSKIFVLTDVRLVFQKGQEIESNIVLNISHDMMNKTLDVLVRNG